MPQCTSESCYLFKALTLVLLDKYPEVGLLDKKREEEKEKNVALTARFSEERISVEGMTLTGWMGYRGRGGGGPKALWFELAGVGQEEHRAAGLLRSHMPFLLRQHLAQSGHIINICRVCELIAFLGKVGADSLPDASEGSLTAPEQGRWKSRQTWGRWESPVRAEEQSFLNEASTWRVLPTRSF